MSLVSSCVSEAWTLLKGGHTETENMVRYFLEACNGAGLSAEALKYIPAEYNVGKYLDKTPKHMYQTEAALKWYIFPLKIFYQDEGDDVGGIEATGTQLPLMNKGNRLNK